MSSEVRSDQARRIGMWSGPRNISTALMRSFENRADTWVVDEPLYARYLTKVPFAHPGREEIIASNSCNYQELVDTLIHDYRSEQPVFYQKHMSHHLFAGDDLDWLKSLDNVLLVREPEAMLRSLARVLGDVSIEQTGLPQQLLIAEFLQSSGLPVRVLESRKVLENPRDMLLKLCKQLKLPFDPCMLNWPAGPRDSDGIWGQYWYHSVWESTSFGPPPTVDPNASFQDKALLKECEQIYRQLLKFEI